MLKILQKNLEILESLSHCFSLYFINFHSLWQFSLPLPFLEETRKLAFVKVQTTLLSGRLLLAEINSIHFFSPTDLDSFILIPLLAPWPRIPLELHFPRWNYCNNKFSFISCNNQETLFLRPYKLLLNLLILHFLNK